MTTEYLIFTAIGEASMCWSEIPKGKFDSENALRIGNKLIEDLKQSAELGFARTLADKLDVHISDEELKRMYEKWLNENTNKL